VPIISIGHKKYDGARPFEMYKIDIPKPAPKPTVVSEQAKQFALRLAPNRASRRGVVRPHHSVVQAS
jgi:hypothetical protein